MNMALTIEKKKNTLLQDHLKNKAIGLTLQSTGRTGDQTPMMTTTNHGR